MDRHPNATLKPNGQMTSAVECFRNAARCEQQAAAATVAANRAVLLAIAADWRERGRLAQAEEAATLAPFDRSSKQVRDGDASLTGQPS